MAWWRSSVGARSLVLLLLATALSGPEAAAQRTPERLGRPRPDTLQRWRETLLESDRLLAAGQWKRVRKRADRLLDEMVARIESGAPAALFLASAAVQRGIAEAGLGNRRDSLWDFEVAVALHPEFTQLDLGLYGEAGANLTRYRRERGELEPFGQPALVLTPPEKLVAPIPDYPRAKATACLEEPIVVRSIIDADGLLQTPTLLSKAYPVLGFAAMDALREWRFEPARHEGRPVPATYNLTVNFRLKLCNNPFATRARTRDERERPVGDEPPR